ncbi:MAG: imelysin family protein [Alphaproteobacteria bacterium]|jgi:putative iron-regulated protein
MNSFFRGLPTLGLMVAVIASPATAMAATAPQDVLITYGDIAEAIFEDSLVTAREMQSAVEEFLGNPNDATLSAARAAWIEARVPYQQSEGLRFGNAYVDEWEGRVNAWPLDEGLLDYVADTYGDSSDMNPLYTLNLIAEEEIRIGARQIDARVIDDALLRELHEGMGVEANVATGYHTIEFLLWGQDLNGTGPGAGNRPASDYDPNACSNENCERRAQFLRVATDLLIEDLEDMTAAWAPGGAARQELAAKGEGGGLVTILTGIGSLSYGELAGERMRLGLILRDPEEEHDCFSDNTHNSHFYNQVGMIALWRGEYARVDGSTLSGASLRDYVMERDPAAVERMDSAMNEALMRLRQIKDAADSGQMAYDQMLGADQPEGNAMIQAAVDALIAQTRADEAVVVSLGLAMAVEGSDSLDNPALVQ